MKAKLLKDRHYPAPWVNWPHEYNAGNVVPVIPAYNQPGNDKYWIDTPELRNDPYGVLLYPGDFEIVEVTNK